MSLSKSQKQLIALSALLAAIVVVLGVFVFSPETFVEEPYAPKTVDSVISRDVLDNPEYKLLRLPIDLPLVPGRMGRDNPFEPY